MSGRLQFSQVIPRLTDVEAAWFPKYIEARHKSLGLDGAPLDYDENTPFPDFKFAIKATEEDWGTYAWFYSDKTASVFQVGELVQEFLKRFRRQECFVMTWAEWDDSRAVAQFDGGGIFVTAEDIETFHACEWTHRREQAFKAGRLKSQR